MEEKSYFVKLVEFLRTVLCIASLFFLLCDDIAFGMNINEARQVIDNLPVKFSPTNSADLVKDLESFEEATNALAELIYFEVDNPLNQSFVINGVRLISVAISKVYDSHYRLNPRSSSEFLYQELDQNYFEEAMTLIKRVENFEVLYESFNLLMGGLNRVGVITSLREQYGEITENDHNSSRDDYGNEAENSPMGDLDFEDIQKALKILISQYSGEDEVISEIVSTMVSRYLSKLSSIGSLPENSYITSRLLAIPAFFHTHNQKIGMKGAELLVQLSRKVDIGDEARLYSAAVLLDSETAHLSDEEKNQLESLIQEHGEQMYRSFFAKINPKVDHRQVGGLNVGLDLHYSVSVSGPLSLFRETLSKRGIDVKKIEQSVLSHKIDRSQFNSLSITGMLHGEKGLRRLIHVAGQAEYGFLLRLFALSRLMDPSIKKIIGMEYSLNNLISKFEPSLEQMVEALIASDLFSKDRETSLYIAKQFASQGQSELGQMIFDSLGAEAIKFQPNDSTNTCNRLLSGKAEIISFPGTNP